MGLRDSVPNLVFAMHMLILSVWSFVLILAASLLYLLILVIYNLKFHPYAKYAGPFWAKISLLYALLHAYRGDLHLDVTRCHEKYGNHHFSKRTTAPGAKHAKLTISTQGSVVRYSPNRLVFNTAEATRGTYPSIPYSFSFQSLSYTSKTSTAKAATRRNPPATHPTPISPP